VRSTRRRADRLSRRSAPWPVIAALLFVGAGCAATGPATSPPTPLPVFVATPSLVETKREVSAYVDSGRYEADVAAVVDQARAFLESRVPARGQARDRPRHRRDRAVEPPELPRERLGVRHPGPL
jgi:hypothetical protein